MERGLIIVLSIGVHIKDKALNVVALSHKSHQLVLEDHFSIPLVSQLDEAAKNLELVQALKQVQEKYKDQTVRLCFALPQNRLSCFNSSFPFSEKFKILKTLPFEIEENTLFHPNNVFFDGRISGFEKNGSSQVISFVALKENVKQFLAPVKQLKIEPYLLSAEGSALANLVENWEKTSGSSTAQSLSRIYIYLDLSYSLALFFQKGRLKNLFHFSWNYKAILSEMVKKYKLTDTEAQAQFAERAFVLTEKKGFAKEQVVFSDLIQKHLKPLVQELELHRLSMEAQEDRSFEEIFLMGPGAVIRNLSAFLSLKLSRPVFRINPMESFPPLHSEKPAALIALGLAMEGLKRPPYTGLNLIYSLQKSKNKLFSAGWLATGLIFVSLTLFSFVRNQEARTLAHKTHEVFAEYGKKIAFIRESRLSSDQVRSFLDKRKKNFGNKEKIKEMLLQSSSVDHLKTLTVHLKDISEKGGLKITHLEIDERKVHIKGLINKDFSSEFKLKLSSLGEKHSLKDFSLRDKNKPHSTPLLSGKVNEAAKNQKAKDSPVPSPPEPSLSDEASSAKAIAEKEVLSNNKIENIKAHAENQIDETSDRKDKNDSTKELVHNEDQTTKDSSQQSSFSYSFTLKQVL